MQLADEALVLTLLPHGEHGAVVRFLGATCGLQAAYVRGARGARMRAIVYPGNRVALRLSARSDAALPSALVEPIASRALIAFRPGPALALQWLTELTAAALSEGVPQPRLSQALESLLEGLAAGLDGAPLLLAIARYELLLLAEEGLGLDLDRCALGGPDDDLAFVSPKSGRAVSRVRAAGQRWAGQLLPLPPALRNGGPAGPADAARALALTGFFLDRHWLRARPALGALRHRIQANAEGTLREQLAASPLPDKALP